MLNASMFIDKSYVSMVFMGQDWYLDEFGNGFKFYWHVCFTSKNFFLNYRSSEFSFNSTMLLKILSHYSAYYCNLWFNSHIKIGTVPVFFKKCSEKFHQKIVWQLWEG